MHNNSNNQISHPQTKEAEENIQGEILLKDQEIEWNLDERKQNLQNNINNSSISKIYTNNNNTSSLKSSSQYGLIDQNLIQQSNLKPTLISQGLFAFDEDERSNLGFLNSQYAYEYKGDMEEFEVEEQEEFNEDDEEEQEEDEERKYAQNQGDYNNNVEMKIDNNTKQFACEYENCGKLFKAKKSLRDHLRIHTNQRPYSCTEPFCGKSFVQYSSLQKHQRTHKGDRPYKCDYDDCDQAFTQVSNLKRHQKIHLNDKPYVCEECLRKFTTLSNLKQHTITHGSQGMRQRFKCVIDECGKSYLYSSSLKKHEKEHILSSKMNPVGLVSSNQIINELCGLHGNNQTNQIQSQQLHQQQQQPLISGEAFNVVAEEEVIQSSRVDLGNNTNNIELINEKEDFVLKDSLVQYEEQLKQPVQQEEYNKSFPETSVTTMPNNVSASYGSKVNMEDMDMLGQFFNSHHVALQHDGHYDVLFKGYLYHYNRKSGKIEIHEIQAHDEITKGTCQPLSEKTHSSNEEITLKVNDLEYLHCKDQTAQLQIIPRIVSEQNKSCCSDIKKSEYAGDSIHSEFKSNMYPGICCSEPNCTKEITQNTSRDVILTGSDGQVSQIEKCNEIQQEQTEMLDNSANNQNNNFASEGVDVEFQNQYQEGLVKSEDCCCILDNIKMECTCIGCDRDCETCKNSEKCILKKKNNNTNSIQHYLAPPPHRINTDPFHLSLQAEIQQNQQFGQPKFKQMQLQNQQQSQQPWWQPVTGLEQKIHTRKCCCLETKDVKHFHGPNCGHVPIYHHGHLDYIVENQLHHPHGTHCDFHGTVSVLDNIARI